MSLTLIEREESSLKEKGKDGLDQKNQHNDVVQYAQVLHVPQYKVNSMV